MTIVSMKLARGVLIFLASFVFQCDLASAKEVVGSIDSELSSASKTSLSGPNWTSRDPEYQRCVTRTSSGKTVVISGADAKKICPPLIVYKAERKGNASKPMPSLFQMEARLDCTEANENLGGMKLWECPSRSGSLYTTPEACKSECRQAVP